MEARSSKATHGRQGQKVQDTGNHPTLGPPLCSGATPHLAVLLATARVYLSCEERGARGQPEGSQRAAETAWVSDVGGSAAASLPHARSGVNSDFRCPAAAGGTDA